MMDVAPSRWAKGNSYPSSLQELAVGPGHREGAARVSGLHLDDAARHPLQEGAVVADHREGEPARREQPLEPQDALQVEVGGRLVEHQQRRLAGQGAGDRQSLAPAAGGGLAGRLLGVGEAGLAEEDAHPHPVLGLPLHRPRAGGCPRGPVALSIEDRLDHDRRPC